MLLDENGDEAGRMVYDGFGGVLTSTMPLTVSNTLPGLPDAVTGLVHLGGGRWYDPTLGRPLQPNLAGGPPTVPQALNRYTATSLGQPGVPQAIYQSSAGAQLSRFQALLDDAKMETIEGIVGIGVGNGIEAYANSSIKGTLSVSAMRIRRLARAGYGGLFSYAGNGQYTSELLEKVGPASYRSVNSGMIIDLAKVNRHYANFAEDGFTSYLRSGFGSEFASGMLVELAFAIPDTVNILGNPYLEPWQKGVQGFSTGAEVFASAYVGALAGEWIAANVGGALAGPVGFVGGVVVGVTVSAAWEYLIEPGVSWIFTSTGFSDPFLDSRNLQPLGGN